MFGRNEAPWLTTRTHCEKPLEFFASIANTDGDCDGQAILPENGHFRAWCTCGNWSVQVDNSDEGLRLARIHTGSASD